MELEHDRDIVIRMSRHEAWELLKTWWNIPGEAKEYVPWDVTSLFWDIEDLFEPEEAND